MSASLLRLCALVLLAFAGCGAKAHVGPVHAGGGVSSTS
jgi:hypothetical protein